MIASPPTKPFSGRALLAWNVASLDAPCVAITWQIFFAYLFQVPISSTEIVTLFLACWLAYSADRWLDGKRFPKHKQRAHRHVVHSELASSKFATTAMFLWFVIALLGFSFAVLFLSAKQWYAGLILLVITIVYFILHAYFPQKIRTWLPREIVVALFFTIAVSLFPFLKLPFLKPEADPLLYGEIMAYGEMVALFFLLCFWNAAGISCWEISNDRAVNEVSLATLVPRLQSIYPLLLIMGMLIMIPLFALGNSPQTNLIRACYFVSTLLLLGIHFSKVDSVFKPPLADAACLTPLTAISCVYAAG